MSGIRYMTVSLHEWYLEDLRTYRCNILVFDLHRAGVVACGTSGAPVCKGLRSYIVKPLLSFETLSPHASHGWLLHEYMVYEYLKSSLAFRKPAVAAASRRPTIARPRLMAPRSASMALQAASAPGEARAPWRAGQARLLLRRSAEAQRQYCLSRRLTIACCLYPPERRRPADC